MSAIEYGAWRIRFSDKLCAKIRQAGSSGKYMARIFSLPSFLIMRCAVQGRFC